MGKQKKIVVTTYLKKGVEHHTVCTVKAGNGQTTWQTEVYDGPDHKRSALRRGHDLARDTGYPVWTCTVDNFKRVGKMELSLFGGDR